MPPSSAVLAAPATRSMQLEVQDSRRRRHGAAGRRRREGGTLLQDAHEILAPVEDAVGAVRGVDETVGDAERVEEADPALVDLEQADRLERPRPALPVVASQA